MPCRVRGELPNPTRPDGAQVKAIPLTKFSTQISPLRCCSDVGMSDLQDKAACARVKAVCVKAKAVYVQWQAYCKVRAFSVKGKVFCVKGRLT